jgi:type IV secretory pathway VirB2 component (pilin)
MTNLKRRCLAILLLAPARLSAAWTNSAETTWSNIIRNILRLMIAPYFLAVPVVALCLITSILLGAFEDRKDLERYSIPIAAVGLLASAALFCSVVFGDSGASV